VTFYNVTNISFPKNKQDETSHEQMLKHAILLYGEFHRIP